VHIGFGRKTWKRAVGKSRRRWEDNIKVDFRGRECGLNSSGS
jgi:hypothetical protein